MSSSVSCLLLAAGYSSRMGQLKALLPIDDKPVVLKLIEVLQNVGINDIYIVLGYNATQIYDVCRHEAVHFVMNHAFDEGMFSSIVCGLQQLPQGRDFLILPVDTPLLNESELVLLLANPPKAYEVIYPTFNYRKGHPPYISANCREKILSYQGNLGLKGCLAQEEIKQRYIEMPTQRLCLDMDTMVDYQTILALQEQIERERKEWKK